MKWTTTISKYIRKFAWAFVVAYMIAWHNVYKERVDMINTVEYHEENDQNDHYTKTMKSSLKKEFDKKIANDVL